VRRRATSATAPGAERGDLPREHVAVGRELLDRCSALLDHDAAARDAATVAFFVPGRIEVLGKHTDYAGGRSLLCALERGICLVARARDDDLVGVTAAATGERRSFRLAPDTQPDTGWGRYVGTVARRIARDFPAPLRGANICFASDLPIAAGMSSSAALVVGTFLVLAVINDLAATQPYVHNIDTAQALADYLAAVENGRAYRAFRGDTGVGTDGGSEDHTAILCARAGELVQYRFVPVRFERSVVLPAGHVFALGCSGVLAEKAGAARTRYNDAAEQLRLAAALWRAATGRADAVLGAALLGDPLAAARLHEILRAAPQPDAALIARAQQFIEESDHIIPAAVTALSGRDLAQFGRLVDRSNELAVTVLRNQIDETVHLATSARALGAVAASAFGAGFGGSVWALVDQTSAPAFLDAWRSLYLRRFPQHDQTCAFFLSRAGPPASRLA
jgi:galactokinase